MPPRLDLAALGDELHQQLHVLVVDVVDLLRAELADPRRRNSVRRRLRPLDAGPSRPPCPPRPPPLRPRSSRCHGLRLRLFTAIVTQLLAAARACARRRRRPAAGPRAIRRRALRRLPPFRGALRDPQLLVDADDQVPDHEVDHASAAGRAPSPSRRGPRSPRGRRCLPCGGRSRRRACAGPSSRSCRSCPPKRPTIASTCVCRSATCSSVASGGDDVDELVRLLVALMSLLLD